MRSSRGPAPLALALLLTWLGAGAAFAQQARIVLRWRDVPGASAYELQIARDAAFVEVVLQTRTTTAGYRWEQLPTVTHWWRVRSIDGEGRASEWSAPRNIAVDSVVPVAQTPADNATWACGTPVTFVAEPSNLVKEYVLQVAATKDFAQPKELRAKTNTFTVPLDPGIWWWRLLGVDLRDKLSDKSPPRAVTVRVSAPKPKAQPDVVPGTAVTLGWSAPECAASFVVEAWSDGGERVTLSAPGPSLLFKTAGIDDYRWRVTALDASGKPGEWSPEQRFRARIVPPVLKEERVLGRAVELAWGQTAAAAGYRVDVSSKDDFKAPELQLAATAPTVRTPKLAPGSWAWRVLAKDAAGKLAAPSEVRHFVVKPLEPLTAPELVRPAQNGVVGRGTVEVAWRPVAEAERYVVELDGVEQAPVSAATQQLGGLKEGTHTVRVRARGPEERDSDYGPSHVFFVGVPKVAKALLEQAGTALALTLVDEYGRPVEGAKPTFFARHGQLLDQHGEGGRFTMRWAAEDSGDDVLVVKERAFTQELALREPALGPLSLSLQGAFVSNFGAIGSPAGGLGLAFQLPWLDRHLVLEAAALGYAAQTDATVPGVGTVTAKALLVPASFRVGWRQAFGGFEARAMVGPSVLWARLEVGLDQELRAVPGGSVAVTLARRIGPGLLFVEVSGQAARVDTTLARLNAGGLAVGFGYAWALPFGAGGGTETR